MAQESRNRRGVFFATNAYVFWGFMPLYFNHLAHIPATELLAHRVVWTVLGLSAILVIRGKVQDFRTIVSSPKQLRVLAASAALLSFNWLIFTWAVTVERVLETSMGYFINPLVSVILGVIFLKERLRRAQVWAVALAAVAVLFLVMNYGSFPWVALTLACTFGLYGLLRKQLEVDAFGGLLMEVLFMLPLATVYLAVLASQGNGAFTLGHWQMNAWLIAAAPITIFPLTQFAMGARLINLTTLGFIQYIAPSITFILAVFIFHEPFGAVQLTTFGLIWISLLIFGLDAYFAGRNQRMERGPVADSN